MKYYLYRLKWWFVDKTGWIPKAPINVDIELAGKCQLACTMCPYGTGDFDTSKQGMMPLQMALDVLMQAKEAGTKAIKLNFRGEPGLHKNLELVARMAKRLGFVDVFINTNLLAFKDARLKELMGCGFDKVIVSIDGTDKKTYEAIRKGGDFDKLVKKIHLINWWKKKLSSETKIILQMVCEKPDEKLKELEADGYRFVEVQDRGQGAAKKIRERRRCPQPRQRLVVAWDGMIFGCCSNWNNEYPIGNISQMSLKEAWNSERLRKLREISEKCDADPCKNCQVESSYK